MELRAVYRQTLKSKKLELVNFDQAFFTHGIEIFTDPEDKQSVYIYAVNHLPSPEFLAYVSKHHPDLNSINHTTPIPDDIPRAQSQIEVFHHKLASSKATHLRSIQHPLIRTPNDIFATGDGKSFYVTNDHFYRGGQMRAVEDVWYYARWSDTIHVQIDDLRSTDPTAGFTATVALTGLHNNNGLGRGASPDEIVITSAASGDMHLARLPSDVDGIKLQVQETVHIDSSIDNPSYFVDKYATSSEDDKSGYVLAGLTKAAELLQSAHDPTASEPIIVWLATKAKDGSGVASWNRTVLFEDDGNRIRSASGAVMIGIDPALEGGKKRAWLLVTGFFSKDMVAVKIDL